MPETAFFGPILRKLGRLSDLVPCAIRVCRDVMKGLYWEGDDFQ